MSKRRHGVDKYPEIEAKIRTGEYTLREPVDKKKHSCKITWKKMRYVYDECEQILADYYGCSACLTIFNLKLRDSGQVLKRHVQVKCPGDAGGVGAFFVPQYQPSKKRKVVIDDKLLVRNAAVSYIVKDMRPICSLNGEGMTTLLSKMTYIGAKYGHLSEEAISDLKLIPSALTVSLNQLTYILHKHGKQIK